MLAVLTWSPPFPRFALLGFCSRIFWTRAPATAAPPSSGASSCDGENTREKGEN